MSLGLHICYLILKSMAKLGNGLSGFESNLDLAIFLVLYTSPCAIVTRYMSVTKVNIRIRGSHRP